MRTLTRLDKYCSNPWPDFASLSCSEVGWSNVKYLAEKLLLSSLFGLLYFGAFSLSSTLDLVDSYAPGISLVFLPAGIKLIAALVR
jgi:putative effector of murein hydrolase LrgA (UPF0299 family)